MTSRAKQNRNLKSLVRSLPSLLRICMRSVLLCHFDDVHVHIHHNMTQLKIIAVAIYIYI